MPEALVVAASDTIMGSTASMEAALHEALAFQRKWQRLSLTAYVLTTAGALIASTAATYFAAGNNGQLAAGLSAFTTICIGLERSFLFREKWKFHLGIATRLFVLRNEMMFGGLSRQQAAERLGMILASYADAIPVAQRDA